MKVLLACEESQITTMEFRKRGHEAYSCDIIECSGKYPEWHIRKNVVPLLKKDWDLIIAFPPCDHIASSGAAWFEEKRKNGLQQKAIDFFLKFTKTKCERVAIENPIGIMSTLYRKPDQIVQPWMFGHGETKATCLWLKNLPKLEPTNIVKGREPKTQNMGYSCWRGKIRSKAYQGIAEAMAKQWGNLNDL